LLPSLIGKKPGNVPYGLNAGYAPTLTQAVAEENPELPAQILSLHQETEFLHAPMKQHPGGSHRCLHQPLQGSTSSDVELEMEVL
jgi:hypothetical protein